MAPNNSPLAPTILPLALAAIGWMALVSNISSTSADVVVQSDASAIRPMAASARGEMVGARGELLGARVAVAQTFIAARGGCGYWRSLAPGVAVAPMVLIKASIQTLGV